MCGVQNVFFIEVVLFLIIYKYLFLNNVVLLYLPFARQRFAQMGCIPSSFRLKTNVFLL